jgi:hypothetical protein
MAKPSARMASLKPRMATFAILDTAENKGFQEDLSQDGKI